MLEVAVFLSLLLPMEDQKKISESLGHLIEKNLASLELPLDLPSFIQGIEDAAAGKSSPLNETQCLEMIAAFQEKKIAEKGEKNLQEATLFLQNNQTKEGIVVLEEGKLQYKIVKSGKGQSVQSYNSPLVRLKGSFLNGEPFQSGYEHELVSLEETIPGFKKGILGMQEGEVRVLYIHPQLSYELQQDFNPNSLLILEVEVVKADASSEAHAASNQESLPFLMHNSFQAQQ
jgi:peptidylprolyl isomerase